jgi:hypothetical protein
MSARESLFPLVDRIEVSPDGDVTFYFAGSDEPWSVREFEDGTPTRTYLDGIVEALDRA